jgi:hypothetical protein
MDAELTVIENTEIAQVEIEERWLAIEQKRIEQMRGGVENTREGLAALYQKKSQALGMMSTVAKTGRYSSSGSGNYAFATKDEVFEAVRPILAEVGLSISTTVLREWTEVEGKTRKLHMVFAFGLCCGDTGAIEISRWVRWGFDNDGMGANRIYSNAQNQWLQKIFAIDMADSSDGQQTNHAANRDPVNREQRSITPPRNTEKKRPWEADPVTDAQKKLANTIGNKLYGNKVWDGGKRAELCAAITTQTSRGEDIRESLTQLSKAEAKILIEGIQKSLDEKPPATDPPEGYVVMTVEDVYQQELWTDFDLMYDDQPVKRISFNPKEELYTIWLDSHGAGSKPADTEIFASPKPQDAQDEEIPQNTPNASQAGKNLEKEPSEAAAPPKLTVIEGVTKMVIKQGFKDIVSVTLYNPEGFIKTVSLETVKFDEVIGDLTGASIGSEVEFPEPIRTFLNEKNRLVLIE